MGDLLQQCEKTGQMELKVKKKRGASGSSFISMGYIIRHDSVQTAHIFGKRFDVLISQLLGNILHHAIRIIITGSHTKGGELSLDISRMLAGQTWIFRLFYT